MSDCLRNGLEGSRPMNDVILANPVDDGNVFRLGFEVVEVEGEWALGLHFLDDFGNWNVLILLFVNLTK